jgi:hypothetical protein
MPEFLDHLTSSIERIGFPSAFAMLTSWFLFQLIKNEVVELIEIIKKVSADMEKIHKDLVFLSSQIGNIRNER